MFRAGPRQNLVQRITLLAVIAKHVSLGSPVMMQLFHLEYNYRWWPVDLCMVQTGLGRLCYFIVAVSTLELLTQCTQPLSSIWFGY
jgi:hypothetical protein